jgi:hypothetical protein
MARDREQGVTNTGNMSTAPISAPLLDAPHERPRSASSPTITPLAPTPTPGLPPRPTRQSLSSVPATPNKLIGSPLSRAPRRDSQPPTPRHAHGTPIRDMHHKGY